jgi:hypothetical protein
VDTLDLSKMQRQCLLAQERIDKLTREVSELRCANGALELEKMRRGFQGSLLEGSQQIFKRIHEIMGDYRRKVNALAHEKKDIEKRYRVLKENIRLTETGSQLKLIDLLTEKIDILENLVEKQQVEIENTISVYESELSKIEEKRKEEVELFENERIGLESENLRLCIDVQKALNRQDSTNLLLLQERNATEHLNDHIVKLTQNVRALESRERKVKANRLLLDSGVIRFYGDNFWSAPKIIESQIIQSVHSAGYQFSNNDENSNRSNCQYGISEMDDSRPPPGPLLAEPPRARL